MFKKILVLLLGIALIVFGVMRLKKDKVIEEPGYLKFMNGNSLVKENKIKEALEEYKLAMDTNRDINIKKNFEIVKNKVEEKKQNQQKDQQNNEQNNEDKNDSQNSNKKSDTQNNEQNKENTPKELTPEEKTMKQKEEELRSILQRLEGNEKQAFKNNERVLNTSENKNNENRW